MVFGSIYFFVIFNCLTYLSYLVSIDTISTAIETIDNSIPERFQLYQNRPNPFNSSAVIIFDVSQKSPVILQVYNLLGQVITTAVNEIKDPGQYQVCIEMNENPAGLYFYTIQMGDFTNTKKMLLLK